MGLETNLRAAQKGGAAEEEETQLVRTLVSKLISSADAAEVRTGPSSTQRLQSWRGAARY